MGMGYGLDNDEDELQGRSLARGRSRGRSVVYSKAMDLRREPIMDQLPERNVSGIASGVSTRERALSGLGLVEGFQQSFTCYVCRDKLGLPLERCLVKPKMMRAHVASHILAGETPPYACGFCGRHNTRCYSYIDRGSTKHLVKPVSNCPYFYKFQVSSIINPRCRGPVCTNIPVLCPGCRDITYVWKYGMQDHWQECHQDLIRMGRRVSSFKKHETINLALPNYRIIRTLSLSFRCRKNAE